jgi:hypothetical protein
MSLRSFTIKINYLTDTGGSPTGISPKIHGASLLQFLIPSSPTSPSFGAHSAYTSPPLKLLGLAMSGRGKTVPSGKGSGWTNLAPKGFGGKRAVRMWGGSEGCDRWDVEVEVRGANADVIGAGGFDGWEGCGAWRGVGGSWVGCPTDDVAVYGGGGTDVDCNDGYGGGGWARWFTKTISTRTTIDQSLPTVPILSSLIPSVFVVEPKRLLPPLPNVPVAPLLPNALLAPNAVPVFVPPPPKAPPVPNAPEVVFPNVVVVLPNAVVPLPKGPPPVVVPNDVWPNAGVDLAPPNALVFWPKVGAVGVVDGPEVEGAPKARTALFDEELPKGLGVLEVPPKGLGVEFVVPPNGFGVAVEVPPKGLGVVDAPPKGFGVVLDVPPNGFRGAELLPPKGLGVVEEVPPKGLGVVEEVPPKGLGVVEEVPPKGFGVALEDPPKGFGVVLEDPPKEFPPPPPPKLVLVFPNALPPPPNAGFVCPKVVLVCPKADVGLAPKALVLPPPKGLEIDVELEKELVVEVVEPKAEVFFPKAEVVEPKAVGFPKAVFVVPNADCEAGRYQSVINQNRA